MTNTLLPPRPPPAPVAGAGAKNYSAASRGSDTSAAAARRRRSPPACRQQPRDLDPRRRKTSPTWKISILNFTQAQRATPRCRHRTAAPHGPSQSSQSMGPRRRHGPPSRFTGRGAPLLLGWNRAVIPGLPQQQTSALQHPPPPFSTKYTMLSTLYAQWSKIINNG